MIGTSISPSYLTLHQGLKYVLKGFPFLLMLLHRLTSQNSIKSEASLRVSEHCLHNFPLWLRKDSYPIQITLECFCEMIRLLVRVIRFVNLKLSVSVNYTLTDDASVQRRHPIQNFP